MKCFLLLTLCCLVGISHAESPDKQQKDVAWEGSTNSWPESLWVYKVFPQEFPSSVISNLLVISGFTQKDKAKTPQYFAENDRKTIFYGELEGHVKHLAICPSLGFIEYIDPKAEAPSQLQKIEGVPNEHEATQLGLKYLRMMGIEVSQLATTNGGGLDLHWQRDTIFYVDQNSKQEITLTNGYGVLFARCIDGVKVHGFGGMDIVFGNNAKVALLRLYWRNLKPYELKKCPSPQDITEHIKNGTISIHPLGSNGVYPPSQFRKITIKQITPLYEGPDYEKPASFIYPYFNFQGTVNDGEKEHGVWFEVHF